MPNQTRLLQPALVFAISGAVCGQAAEKPVDFAHDVAPILRKHCVECHGGGESKGGFSLNTRELLLDAAAAAPEKADQSRMIELIESADPDEQMPPRDKPRLSPKEVRTLRRWIDEGLQWEDGVTFAEDAYQPPLRHRRVSLPEPAAADRTHPIDRLVDRYLGRRGLPPLEPISDAEFARRAHLDLIGLLPEPARLQQFLDDQRPDKRERLVDELLGDNVAWAEHWLTFWNDLLRNDYTGTGFITGGRKQITGWLYRSLVENKPYDQFVRELIAPSPESEGFILGIRWRGDVNSSQTQEIQFAQNVSQSLLGINMKCASCHDSFIDRWTLEETYGLAQIYASSPLELHRCDKPTGRLATAAWIFPELGQVDPQAPQPQRLKQLAALITHRDNGRLTRTIVNRIWHRLMGRGIVHPVDAMHTRPWSEDLLDWLASDLADNGYDLKRTMRQICSSQAYQARIPAAEKREGGPYVFRGPLPRRLTAEQFMDSVWQLTGAAPRKHDANVVRGERPQPQADAPQRVARWIWSDAAASQGAPAGQTISLRQSFALDGAPQSGFVVVTCDNEYQLFVNGKKAGGDDNWTTVETIPLLPHLKQGDNQLLVVATNGGAGPNPAGLLVQLQAACETPQGPAEVVVGSDGQWQWADAKPDGRGSFGRRRIAWRQAAEVGSQDVWKEADSQFRSALQMGERAGRRMVRAALVKSDSLMRTLGRPNRDQVVTSRPDTLTTLEAIDLANGQRLADALADGARRLAAEHQDAEQLSNWLFRHALSRPPTSGERQLAVSLLGDPVDERAVEDLLWSVLMLPEFLLVR